MLEEVVDLANAHKCEALVFTGDLFHVKRPDRTSHYLVGAVIGELQAAKMPVLITPGNHDMGAAGIDGLWDQPLGVVDTSGAAEVSFMKTTESFMFFSKPYSEKYDIDPDYYRPNPQDLLRARGRTVVVVAHGSIVPDGTDREFPTLDASKALHSATDILVCGHIHEDLGVHRYDTYQLFVNVGALGRTARTKANMTRTVKVAIVNNQREVTEIPLKSALPAEEAFKPEAPVVESEEQDEQIQAFITAMSMNAKFEKMELSDYAREACKGLSEEMAKRVLAYLEE